MKPGAGLGISSLLLAVCGDLESPSGHLAESSKAEENLEPQVVHLSLVLISHVGPTYLGCLFIKRITQAVVLES